MRSSPPKSEDRAQQMRVYELQKGSTSLEGLRLAERPTPEPGSHEILVRIRATSLNYRDHLIVVGKYPGGAVDRDIIPLSDGAGEVVAVGPGVTRFRTGDRVAGMFFQVWKDGPRSFLPPALGVPHDPVPVRASSADSEGLTMGPIWWSYQPSEPS